MELSSLTVYLYTNSCCLSNGLYTVQFSSLKQFNTVKEVKFVARKIGYILLAV